MRHQRADQRDQFGGRAVLHLNQPGFQAIRRGAAAVRLGLGFGIGHDARLLALGDHAETVGGHHREKQLIDLAEVQRRARHHADLTLDPRVDDKGLAADLRHLVDKLADIGALEVDGPAVLLLIGGGRGGVADCQGGQGSKTQAGGQQGKGKAGESRHHGIRGFPWAEPRARCRWAGRRKPASARAGPPCVHAVASCCRLPGRAAVPDCPAALGR